MLTVERVPLSYRNHRYWDPNDNTTFMGSFLTEQTNRISSRIHEVQTTSRPTAAYTDRICAHCATQHPTQQCSRCKGASYCDRECQVAHWTVHKKHCNNNKARSSSSSQQQLTPTPTPPLHARTSDEGELHLLNPHRYNNGNSRQFETNTRWICDIHHAAPLDSSTGFSSFMVLDLFVESQANNGTYG